MSVEVASSKPKTFNMDEGFDEGQCVLGIVEDVMGHLSAGFYDLARDTDKGVEVSL